jgi:hypothetical protein
MNQYIKINKLNLQVHPTWHYIVEINFEIINSKENLQDLAQDQI